MTRSRQIVSKTEVVAENGVVTAMHPLAAEAGVSVLKDGGNAADAAVATALAVGVVEPFMNGLGGCSYAISYQARTGRTLCVDGSTLAPLNATPDMFELEPLGDRSAGLYGWRATKGDVHETGYRAATVPGTIAALAALHREAGSKPWAALFEPAIRLAAEGYPVDEYVFAHSAASAARLAPFAETMAVYFRPDGTPFCPSFPPAAPVLLRQPELANTLRSVAADGHHAFYRGAVGARIVEHLRAHGSVITAEDFSSYEARVLSPDEVTYRGSRVVGLPAPSGGTTLSFALKLLEGFELGSLSPESAEHAHLVAEALGAAFGDRFRFLGDPEMVDVPLGAFSSDAYLAEWRAQIDPSGASFAPDTSIDPWQYVQATPSSVEGGSDSGGQHTTHLNVIDRDRNMVSLTGTLGGRFGSGVTVPGTGVVLNNGMMWYDPEPGRLASIAPGKRALHAAAPCLVMNGTDPVAAIGSPGGRMIMSAVLQVLVHVLDHGMGIQAAIEAPRLHREAGPAVRLDLRYPEAVADELSRRGHEVLRVADSFLSAHFGRPNGITIDSATERLHGGVEPYRISAAVGY